EGNEKRGGCHADHRVPGLGDHCEEHDGDGDPDDVPDRAERYQASRGQVDECPDEYRDGRRGEQDAGNRQPEHIVASSATAHCPGRHLADNYGDPRQDAQGRGNEYDVFTFRRCHRVSSLCTDAFPGTVHRYPARFTDPVRRMGNSATQTAMYFRGYYVSGCYIPACL